MMDDIKKNELNEQEMENVAGGKIMGPSHKVDMNNYRPSEPTDFDKATAEAFNTAIDAVSEAAGTAWEVVKYTFEKNFLK